MKKPIQRFEEIEILSQPKLEQLALRDEYGIIKSDSELEVALYELQETQMKARKQGVPQERVMKESVDAYHDITKHPKIKYEFSPPGSAFKQSLMEKYVRHSPFTYQMSRPPQVIDLTNGRVVNDKFQPREEYKPDKPKSHLNDTKLAQCMVTQSKEKIK